jgi:hypothetical protein
MKNGVFSSCRLTALLGNDDGEWKNEFRNSIDMVESMQSPRFIKSHLIWELLPAALDTVKPKVQVLNLICVSLKTLCKPTDHMNYT